MDIHSSARLLVGVGQDEAALEHTSREEAFRTFDSSLLPSWDPFGKMEWVCEMAVLAVAVAAAVMSANGLASLQHDIVGIVLHIVVVELVFSARYMAAIVD